MSNRQFRANAGWLGDILNSLEITEVDRDWVTGRFDPATGLLIPDPTLDADPGNMWVHPLNGRASSQMLIGDRMWALSRTAGKRIVVGRNALNQMVAYAPYVAAENAAAVQNAITAMVLNLPAPAQNLTGGRVLAHPDGGLQVWVEKYEPVGWAGGALAVDAGDLPVGTNGFRWLVVYFAEGDNTPSYAGTVERALSDKALLPASDAWNLGLPAGAIRTQAFTVFTGETDITNANTRWLEMRRLFTPEAVVTATNVMISADGYPLIDADGHLMLFS